MTAFTNPGTNLPNRITFNAGTIDFGSSRLVQVENVVFTIEWTIADLFTLGSIKPQDKVRHSQRVSLTGKIRSFSAEMENVAWGSSTTGTPQEIDTLDGQPTYQSPVLTLFDRNNKEIQYQLSGAIFKSDKLTASAENYGEWDFELESKDVTLLYTA